MNKDVYKTPAAKMFACTLEAPDGLSWNLFGAKFGGGMAPWLTKSAYDLNQVATVTVATDRIAAAAAKIAQSYLSGGVKVQSRLTRGSLCQRESAPPHDISIGSVVFVWLACVLNTETDRQTHTDHATCDISNNT